jgi:peptide/nickel transport system ATP-binding protein
MTLVAFEDVTVAYASREGTAYALDRASLAIEAGERVGIIGESGSGKTTLAMSIGRLLPSNATVESGRIAVAGRDVASLAGEELRQFRYEDVGYIFQSPVASLDPTKRIEKQLRALTRGRPELDLREVLRSVELSEPERVLRSFPHELSGGMAQRVAIAIVLVRTPRLIVADEPTASLDAIVRGRILKLLFRAPTGPRAAILFFTHDLAAVRAFCDRVVVMYGGRIVEDGPRDRVLGDPLHPYTRALLGAVPGRERPDARLTPIPGSPPVLRGAGGGCAFAPRCAHVTPSCAGNRPLARELQSRVVVCHQAEAILEQEVGPVG